MAREKVQTRCDSDTTDAIENYADEHDVSESEAVRRLIRAGLIHHGYEIDVPTRRATLEQQVTVKTVIATLVIAAVVTFLLTQYVI